MISATIRVPTLFMLLLLWAAVPAACVWGQEKSDAPPSPATFREQMQQFLDDHYLDINGFLEGRAGYRFLNDPYEKDMSILETRLQLEMQSSQDWGDIEFKGDTYADQVMDETEFDLREGNIALTPLDFMDVKVGRQVLTWGTGDLLFLNDMFPKDWQSFFIGRDTEYLKAPSDAAKISLFSDWVNLDIVYTPQFDPDRYIKGERLSYFNPLRGEVVGDNSILHSDKPNRWFQDDEWALRLYKTIHNYEIALYGYQGYWKSPGGFKANGQALFPDLNVYGSSLRGAVGKGIGNIELAYYQSAENESGNNPMLKNSEMRYLVGYTRELARDFTAGVQYYVEQMLNYGRYHDNLGPGQPARDRYHQLITLRLTQLLMNQNLRLGLFTYYSPSDNDTYMRPNVHYKVTDNLAVEGGANVFFGDYNHTFFGQFHRDSNFYTSVRYSF